MLKDIMPYNSIITKSLAFVLIVGLCMAFFGAGNIVYAQQEDITLTSYAQEVGLIGYIQELLGYKGGIISDDGTQMIVITPSKTIYNPSEQINAEEIITQYEMCCNLKKDMNGYAKFRVQVVYDNFAGGSTTLTQYSNIYTYDCKSYTRGCSSGGFSSYNDLKVTIYTAVPKTEGKYKASVIYKDELTGNVRWSEGLKENVEVKSAPTPTPPSKPTCNEGYTGNRYCEGQNVVQNYKYSNCDDEKKVMQTCTYGCESGSCKSKPTTDTTTNKTCNETTKYYCESNIVYAKSTLSDCSSKIEILSKCSNVTTCTESAGSVSVCVPEKDDGSNVNSIYYIMGAIFLFLVVLVGYIIMGRKGGKR